MKALIRSCAVALLFGAVSARAQAPATSLPGSVEPSPPPAALSPTAPPAEPSAPHATRSESGDAAPPASSEVAAEAEAAGLSEAELQELGFATNQPAVDTSIRLSGFMDFGTSVALNDGTKLLFDDHAALYMGNVNVYLSKNLSETVRTMMEVRLLYLPNGSPMSASDSTIIRSVANDYADYNRPLRWGGIEFERVYFEWAMLSYLTIRIGQFLTPYGIWNVDHGSPTIITAGKPFVVGAGFFPERQTGFELYGKREVTNYSAIGYHLTLSNGTGPVTEYRDLDGNKAVGARAYWEQRRRGELRLGGSFYYGRSTDANVASGLAPGGGIMKSTRILSQRDSLSFAVDAQWKYQGVHVQAEWIGSQATYTDKGRTPVFSIVNATNAYPRIRSRGDSTCSWVIASNGSA